MFGTKAISNDCLYHKQPFLIKFISPPFGSFLISVQTICSLNRFNSEVNLDPSNLLQFIS